MKTRHLLLPLLLASAPAFAQSMDLSKGGPVQVNAASGIDWRQNDQVVIARGDARAIRGNVTVTADELIAHYRKKAAAPGTPPAGKPDKAAAAAPAPDPAPGTQAAKPDDQSDESSGNEVYRLEAAGHVHIFTATDQAWGDHAVYDMDQSVLVLTGHGLRLLTPQDLLTARDSMEYWPQKHEAVARGNAVVLTNDGRRIAADVLVAFTSPGQNPPAPATPAPAPAAPPIVQVSAKPPADPLLASGKLQRVEAYGNVDIRTPTETVHGDRGVYVDATGRARIVGRVHITRGDNQLNGNAADVDMKSGLATMLSGPQQRIQGLIVPNDAQAGAQTGAQTGAKPAAAPKPKPAAKGGL